MWQGQWVEAGSEFEGIVLGMSLESGREDCLLGTPKDQSYVLPERKPSAGLPVCSTLPKGWGPSKGPDVHLFPSLPLSVHPFFYPSFSIFHPSFHSAALPVYPSVRFPFLSLISFIHSSLILSVHLKVPSSHPPSLTHPHILPSPQEAIMCFLRNLGRRLGAVL